MREHKTSLHAIGRVIKEEGFLGLYNGCVCNSICNCSECKFVCNSLSAGLLRQATYSTTRLGVYQSLFDKFSG